ncbi:hypothetical protein [Bifidobacterium callitrichidarum]|uniref:Phage-Barnase-EndoU-ColicinE5/D-RelE like nuclease 4 domain-containing protein n=1 Tax=Bifidobacterium callitrichidarum TaxID=2052941 RepID=A0A2U2N5B5_9BIFI|nr:hypothetical protein [Bifidobacterium callitrichidarum]PWG64421.1 hypothetical protein DF196_09060 [Bifidobacterium callitrichidarum]
MSKSKWTEDKIKWLRSARRNILPEYRRLMDSGCLRLECAGRDDVCIVFLGENLAHLLGFAYVNEKRARIARRFPDDLHSGAVAANRIEFADKGKPGYTPQKGHDDAAKKNAIAQSVFSGIDSLDINGYVVESAKSAVVLFTGKVTWSLGLAKEKDANDVWTGRYVPASLVDDSILSSAICKAGTKPSAIIRVSWI